MANVTTEPKQVKAENFDEANDVKVTEEEVNNLCFYACIPEGKDLGEDDVKHIAKGLCRLMRTKGQRVLAREFLSEPCVTELK